MKPASILLPGLALGSYPERANGSRGSNSGAGARRSSRVLSGRLDQRRQQRFVSAVESHSGPLSILSEDAFQARVKHLRARLGAEGFVEGVTAEAFALVREATRRHLGLSQYPTQLIAGRIMLDNRLAEMATGEGKTLTAALTAATAALTGIPVHVITANDYLVGRDAELLGPVYRSLGLSVGAVMQPMDQAERRAAYACNITYCTAKELVFDYLRDRLVRRQTTSDLHERVRGLDEAVERPSALLLRGLCMALVDEADSILVDEARTPFILSQQRLNVQEQRYWREALDIAMRMRAGNDFTLDRTAQQAMLSETGREKLALQADAIGGLWLDRRHREEIVTLALSARHLYHRDQHYLVRDGKLLMIDQTTGRVAHGRIWSRGLHQLIEVKEGCKPSGDQETIAQITYQRFFPRYLRLCGMSGTLSEAQPELRSVYGLGISRVPLRKPSQRAYLPIYIYATREEKWQAVVERARAIAAAGCPVLIGTDSVADSDQLAIRLAAYNVAHVVLNARNDGEEAALVAAAGEAGRITVTTNMAGRGTDIPLGAGVAQRGGLHVICCQHNSSPRIDRQLQGRCARQGDPGNVQTILSLEDGLVSRYLPAWLRRAAATLAGGDRPLPAWLGALLAWAPQRLEEHRQRLERRALLQHDEQIEARLSFAGRGE
jgi:preprotein translocase subunit SecA